MKKKAALKIAFAKEDITKYPAHLKDLVEHKYMVAKGMKELGLPLSQRIKHDLSKLTPSEFKFYSQYWHGPKGSKRDPKVLEKYLSAVDKHKESNPHHTHYWKKRNLPKPLEYQLESLADQYAASLRKKKIPFKDWLINNSNKFTPEVKEVINKKLNV